VSNNLINGLPNSLTQPGSIQPGSIHPRSIQPRSSQIKPKNLYPNNDVSRFFSERFTNKANLRARESKNNSSNFLKVAKSQTPLINTHQLNTHQLNTHPLNTHPLNSKQLNTDQVAINLSATAGYARLLMSQEYSQIELQKLQLLSQIQRSCTDASLQPLRNVRS